MLALALATAALAVEVQTADGPIAVDGVLDEPAWALAEPVTDFLRFQPADGGPPPGRTEVRFVQDARHLYVGIRVTDAGYPIRARISPREDVNADDQVGVYLDPWGAARSGFVFYLNPLGIQQDIQVVNGRWNMAWNTVLHSRGHVEDDGYVIELAIPFRSLKYPRGADETWGLILTRKIPSEGAKYAAPKVERNHPRWFAQAMPLTGVDPAPRGSGVELQPGLAVLQGASREARSEPLAWSGFAPLGAAVRPSLDLRLGLTENTGITATLNPDFSQVEFDETPVALNQRFAFSFAERRPFFLEGQGNFQDAADTLYSRSIVDPVAGLKLAGREGTVDLALLHAIDRAPAPSITEGGTPGFGAEEVDGEWAASSLGRVSVDVGDGGWAALTVADKRLLDADGDRGPLGHHDSAGVELSLPLGDKWTLSANNQQSLTGEPGDVRWGQGSHAALWRPSGDGLGAWIEADDYTRDYRQELGFRTQGGYSEAGAGASWTFEPDGVVDVYTPGVGTWHKLERNGDRSHGVWMEHEAVLGGIHTVDADLTLLRTLEQGVTVDGWIASAGYASEWTAAVTVGLDGEVSREVDYALLVPALGLAGSAVAVLRPTTSLRIDLSATLERFTPRGAAPRLSERLRGRVQAQFTRELGFRLVAEHVDGTDRPGIVTGSALATWLLHPGTEVHVGYTERLDVEQTPWTMDRLVFVKATVLARL